MQRSLHAGSDLQLPRLGAEDRALFQEAWDTARARHGRSVTFYLPGMIRYGDRRGRYPAVSITGNACELQCDHCRGLLLRPMIPAQEPAVWVEKARRLARRGAHGILISGGADARGRLPWKRFAPSIARISRETRLFLTAHTGFPDLETAGLLRQAGVRQALIDVMGDDETARRVYHLPSLDPVTRALDALAQSGPPLAPHIVAGLHYGRLRGEARALEILSHHAPDVLVIVVLTPLSGTPLSSASPPDPLDVARLMARARIRLPHIPLSLGCERPRNRDGAVLEILALRAGVTRMAVWSEQAVLEARRLGLIPRFQTTCCSLPFLEPFSSSGPGSP